MMINYKENEGERTFYKDLKNRLKETEDIDYGELGIHPEMTCWR